MKYNSDIHHRRSIRLKGYDYSEEGWYFITICTHNRMCLFGKIENGEMVLNEHGRMAQECLMAIPNHYFHAKLDQFVIMPNHIHFVIEIVIGANVMAKNYSTLSQSPAPHGTSKTIGSIVRGCKIGITKLFRENTDIHMVWQRNYHEHIIRDEKSYDQISEYIQTNPLKWQDDKYFEHQSVGANNHSPLHGDQIP